jgi:hypothetical protein
MYVTFTNLSSSLETIKLGINMGKIAGHVKVLVTKTDGKEETLSVNGSQFGLEEGGDWSRDRDDGELFAGFLYIAFLEGFDLVLSLNIRGNTITHYSLDVREEDFETNDISLVKITEDELDVDSLFPSDEVDDF